MCNNQKKDQDTPVNVDGTILDIYYLGQIIHNVGSLIPVINRRISLACSAFIIFKSRMPICLKKNVRPMHRTSTNIRMQNIDTKEYPTSHETLYVVNNKKISDWI